ncbi:MAG TPA: Rpn family recombination-promoting nuclease/putative transposase, partial [Spirochaetota bacterium]|nr:Rpn family recombination-promoting nuclease/putative transposase [Spirochaetota bacterium]
MTKKHNFHDSGYKKFFSNPEMICQLLTYFVDEGWTADIDYSSLQRIDKSFVTDEFANRESDLVYKAYFKGKEVYIFLLLEFQSTVDRFMALRMLRYITELYEYLIKSYRIKMLPAVFPVMLYNGEKRWTVPEELNKLIEKSIPEKYIPDFRYYKIAENEFNKDFLRKIKNSVSALFYAENSSGDELTKEFKILTGLLKAERPQELSLFVKWFKYMFSDRDDVVEEVKGLEEAKTMLRSSIKEMSKKLINEGMEKGIQKGLQAGKLETAAALLNKKMPV